MTAHLAHIARRRVTMRLVGPVSLGFVLIACGGAGEPGSPHGPRTESASPVAPERHSVALRFPQEWVAGQLSYETTEMRVNPDLLPLSIALRSRNPAAAIEQLRILPASGSQCFVVRILYRPSATAPARRLEAARFHEPVLWSPAPVVCWYAGMEWQWNVLLRSGDAPIDASHRDVTILTSGAARAPGEQYSVALLRHPRDAGESLAMNRNFERLIVAQSDWVSLPPR